MADPLFEILEQHQDQLKGNRHRQAQQIYQAGMRCLNQAQKSGFENKPLLKEAATKLNQAIRLNRQDPHPYLSMAYLLMLLLKYPEALRYLKQAQTSATEHPKVQEMLDLIQQLQKKASSPAAVAPAVPEARETRAALPLWRSLSEAKMAIMAEVKRVMEEFRLPQPDGSAENQAIFQRRSETLQAVLNQLESNLLNLSQTADTQELDLLLGPIRSILKRFEKAIQICVDFQQLFKDIERVMLETSGCFESLAQQGLDASSLNPRLETILDDCDAIADRLDALAEQKIAIQPLEENYGKLVTYVQNFQDFFESLT